MTPKQEITDLTICRAVFAGWVFIYHVDLYLNFSAHLGPFANLIRHGYLGVDGFFILSGLILARVHPELGKSRSGAVKFWGKRLARIYPVHFATLMIFAGIFLTGVAHGMAPRDPARFSLSAFVQNLFLVHGWGFTGQGAWNYPSWTISTEWAGYLLFPMLWFAISYYMPLVAIQVTVVCFAALGLVVTEHHLSLNLTFAWGLIRFFPEFIVGVCTARFVPVYADIAPRKAVAIFGAGLLLVSVVTGLDLFAVVGLWTVIFAFMMQADAELPPMLGRRPALRWLGLLSYAFYMSFAVAELLLTQGFRHLGWAPAGHAVTFSAGMLTITLALAVSLHLVIEQPCRRAADRWLDRTASP